MKENIMIETPAIIDKITQTSLTFLLYIFFRIPVKFAKFKLKEYIPRMGTPEVGPRGTETLQSAGDLRAPTFWSMVREKLTNPLVIGGVIGAWVGGNLLLAALPEAAPLSYSVGSFATGAMIGGLLGVVVAERLRAG